MTTSRRRILDILLAVLLVAGAPRPARALLCAIDDVPAGTLLFPFVTGRYAPEATATNPVADRAEARSLFSITNASSTPRIVHLVLSNDFSFPLLSWDMLMNGYQTIELDFADIMEGKLRPTGGAFSPIPPVAPQAPQGPVASFFPSEVAKLPKGIGVGKVSGATDTLYGLCTNPTFTPGLLLPPDQQGMRLPDHLRAALYNGLTKSQVIAENGWWGSYPPLWERPDWVANRSRNDSVHASITVDVVAACGGGGPWEGSAYFSRYARPVTASYYANDPATGFVVGLGNTLLGEWIIRNSSGSRFESGRAVGIEMDNQDVENSPLYPRELEAGGTFYRYGGPGCAPGEYPGEPTQCRDLYTSVPSANDWVRGSPLFFGPWNGPLPSDDYREPLPSSFAFRWLRGATHTRIRVWKEAVETTPYYGFTYALSTLPYAYYSFDDDGRVWSGDIPCDVCTCPTLPNEIGQLPLATQEIPLEVLNLPWTSLQSGWIVMAFLGSNGVKVPVPGGYEDPALATIGAQAWIEVVYTNDAGHSTVVRPTVLGNWLCNRCGSTSCPRDGRSRIDHGDVFY